MATETVSTGTFEVGGVEVTIGAQLCRIMRLDRSVRPPVVRGAAGTLAGRIVAGLADAGPGVVRRLDESPDRSTGSRVVGEVHRHRRPRDAVLIGVLRDQ